MKRLLLILLLGLVAVAVSACGSRSAEVQVGDRVATVYVQGENTLHIVSGDQAWNYSNFTLHFQTVVGAPPDEEFLNQVVEQWRHQNPWWPGRRPGSYWFWGVLVIGLGALNIKYPRFFWFLSEGWKFRDAEPSDVAIFLGQAGGVVTIIIGIVLLFV